MTTSLQFPRRKSLVLTLFLSFLFVGAAPEGSLLERLARPEMEGRGVGTAGLAKARDLIVSEIEKRGWKPGFAVKGRDWAVTESYLQPFRVFIGNHLGAGNRLGSGLVQRDFIPLAFSKSGSVASAELVFAGFGISLRNAGDAVYDDYAGLDVKGKIVVVMLGDPATGAKNSVFRNPAFYQYSMPAYKVRNAELHGAAGIVLVRDPLSLPAGAEPELRFLGHQGGGVNDDILAVQAKNAFVEHVLGVSLRTLQEKIALEQKPASFFSGSKIPMAVDLVRDLGDVQNIAAYIEGSDPVLKNEVIVIGAHYDHLGYGGDSSLDPNGIGKVHPGADDNASGDQAVLLLGEKIAKAHTNKRSVLLMFFSAEEIGLLGSDNFVQNLALRDGQKIVMMLNLDMVGRLNENKLSVLALKSGKEFRSLVEDTNKEFGFDLVTADSGFGSSDHASFLKMKIPSLFLTTGAHEDYHRPSDTADKINWDGLLRVDDFAYSIWQKIDGMANAPTYDPSSEDEISKPRDHGYGVYFGSIPEFAQGEDVVGVLLQGTLKDSPAEKAGLKQGDIITAFGEITIRNLYDLVFALRYYRPNDEVTVVWTRNGVKMEAKVTVLARDGER